MLTVTLLTVTLLRSLIVSLIGLEELMGLSELGGLVELISLPELIGHTELMGPYGPGHF